MASCARLTDVLHTLPMTQLSDTADEPEPPQFPHVAAVLVLFAPHIDPSTTLRTVLGVVGQVILVDNSPAGHPMAAAWQGAQRVAIVENANRGALAGGYNAARRWLEQNSPSTSHIAFIDDDSDASVLRSFLADAGVAEALVREDTAAVAPAHRDRATGLRARHLLLSRFRWRQLAREVSGLQRVSFVINSMSVWPMAALQRIGAHNEWLGVDHVDTEYCIRADRVGLRVYLHGDHEFAQSIGRRRAYTLLGHQLQSGGHSAQRRHSIGRSNAWLACAYLSSSPAFAALRTSMLFYEALGILSAEDEKMSKLGALGSGSIAGIAEGLRGLRMRSLSFLRRVWSQVKRLGPRARTRRRLADKYLRGEGIEIGALHNPLQTSARVRYVDRLSRADLRRHYPELAAFPVVDPDVVDDGELLTKIDNGSLDFIIANHFIEHCEDPIGTLKTFARKLQPGGVIYMAVPDKRFTFDKRRPSTTIDHLEHDHFDRGVSARWGHYFEFAQLACSNAVAADDKTRELATKQLSEGYSIHFHVWTQPEFQTFLEHVRATHLLQLTIVESIANGDEGIFILRQEGAQSGCAARPTETIT